MRMSDIPLSRVMAAWVAAVIILVVGTIALAIFGGGSTESVGPSAFSRSAIGYAGIADVMHRLGARVLKNRGDSIASLDPAGVLVVAEPLNAPAQRMSTLMNAHTVLLILPKWTAQESKKHRGWISDATEVAVSTARSAAQIANVDVVRVPRVTSWSRNEIGRVPVISQGGVQLIIGDVAALLAAGDHLLDRRAEAVHQRAVGRLVTGFAGFAFC